MSHFLISKCGESYLNHVSLPISASQKCELLITPSLFSQGLLEKVSCQVKEDSFISSTMSLAKLAWPRPLGRGKSSSSSGSSHGAGSSGYTSPLDYGRTGPSSSSDKRSASPGRDGGS